MSLTGYSDPGAVASSDIIDATWGNDVRDNQVAFAGFHTSGHYVDINTTTVTGTSDETTILSFTVPGDSLGTGNIYRFQIECRAENAGGDVTNFINYSYGSTEFAQIGGFNGATTVDFTISGFLLAAGASNSQRGKIAMENRTNANFEDDFGGIGTAAEDSTGDLNLVVTVDGSSDLVFYKYASFVEYHQV